MRRTLITVTCTVFLVAAGAMAQDGPAGHGRPGWFGGTMGAGMEGEPAMGGGPRLAAVLTQVLSLTQEQTTAWQKIRDNTKATIKPLVRQERQLHQEIRSALEAGGADPAAVGSKMIAAHDLQTKIKAAAEAGRSAFRALLTPEQQGKLDTLEQARMAMRGSRHMGPPPQH